MRKNYCILVLTFLCMLCGQMGYGQKDKFEGETELPEFELCYDIEGNVETFLCYETITKTSTSFNCDTNEIYNSYVVSYDINPIDCFADEFDDEELDDCDPDNPDYLGDCACYQDCGEQERTWYLDYDGDGYHSATEQSVYSPGAKWRTTTSGVDCDDTRSQYTTVCCIKTCDSGYKLNEDTCECILL